MRIQKLNYETKTNLLEDLLQRSPNQYTQYESRVLEILEHVKNEKDQAVFDYTKQFDGADITADTITVTKEEIAQAYAHAPEHIRRVIVLGSQMAMRIGPLEMSVLRRSDVGVNNSHTPACWPKEQRGSLFGIFLSGMS